MNRHRVGCAVALATLWSTGAVAQQPGDAEVRIRQLEATVQQLMREIDTLKAALPAQPAAGAAPAADAAEEPSSEARRAQRLERRRVDDIQFDVQETRERVDAMQSRLDAQVPNARLENGLVIEDSRGRWALRVTGRAQMDYRSYDNDAVADTFGIRRARIGAGLTMGKFGALIETELTFGAVGGNNPTTVPQGSPTNAVLHQAYVDFNPFDALRFRLGQFKPAFGMENTMSTWAHDFQERSLAFGLMQNFLFDRGLMISGAPTPYTTYALSITNGTGQNVDEVQSSAANARVDGKDYIGRVTANFASLLDQPDWVLHGAANYRTGRIANNSNSGTADTLGANGYVGAAGVTESRGLVFFAPSPFNANPAVSGDVIDRTIWGLETAIAYRSVKLQGEYFRATYAGNRLSPGQPAFEPGIDAGYIAANWLITGEQF
ncbi:MAG: hypothetical protein KIT73_18230, partial [Burkholderiales bacterium]|nr:hypothetical protein [Burkholderiales bacterium]